MPDSDSKLKIVPRKRRKSVKSRIRQRANEQVKQAAVEARKTAVLEYVGEQVEELLALLRSEGFRISRTHDETAQVAISRVATMPPPVQNPCGLCGRAGVVLNETKTGWLCATHGQYELGGAAQDRVGQNLAAEMFKPTAPRPVATKPTGPKMIIHPNAPEQSKIDQATARAQIIDPLKGIQNGTVGVLEDDGEEAGAE